MRGNLIDVIDENPMLVEDEPFISAEESLGNVNENKCELMGTVEKRNEINDCNGKTEDNKGLISDNTEEDIDALLAGIRDFLEQEK